MNHYPAPGQLSEGGEIPVLQRDGLILYVVRLKAGERREFHSEGVESALVLISGQGGLRTAKEERRVSRDSLFSEKPWVLSLPCGGRAQIQADSNMEWVCVKTENPTSFEPRIFEPQMVTEEDRGRDWVQGTCRRWVRQVFDKENHSDSNLVVGEVVNRPGLWSSYPPHHHAQPEIYHYRFSKAQGYGHSEVGECVYKIKNGDTVFIPGGLDHAQVAAPGYDMYYLWAVRHLDGAPYRGFEYTPEHRWILEGV